ncbi:radical SAM additional 4Fe4S-binding SPASM domain-containing protein [Lachnospiraceae bacterium A10]|nr:radical SAM additional 4Fe4S-binding SPASM domain-containing protein [Lachnospiraceae bacterium A10]
MNLVHKIKEKYLYRKDINQLVSKDIEYPNYELKNDNARFIINELYSGRDINQIVNAISEKYKVDRNTVENDVMNFLEGVLKNKYRKKEYMHRGGIPNDGTIEKLAYPMSIEIELTRRCNWRCRFCYNVWKHTEKINVGVDLDINIFKRIIDECVRNGCNTIKISGGEPTYHPFFNEMVSYASAKGCKLVILTNGSNVDEAFIKLIKENNVLKVLLSLHGLKEQHEEFTGVQGSYDTTISAIKLLIENGVDISVETLLSKKVTNSILLEMAGVLKELGVKYWNFMPFVKTGSAKIDNEYLVDISSFDESIEKIISEYGVIVRVVCSQKLCYKGEEGMDKQYVDANCGAGIYWLSVSYDGKVRSCPHSDIYAGFVLDGIEKIYIERIKPRIMKIISKKEDECALCLKYDECKGGCYLDKIGSY